ncbi:sterol carrier protein 2-like [Lineus longissimus]|uniref:sterol carrier protein 2-like n=1 Tax=Lineus longissimus TaxID=88925 RepID=UPI00315D83EF
MSRRTRMASYVCGVGMTRFSRPFTRKWDYPDIGAEAARKALADARIDYSQVEAVVASYSFGDTTSGQKAVYKLGLTGVPIFNVNNACSSGSSALFMARMLVQSGYKCVLAVGFEKSEQGLSARYTENVSPYGLHTDHLVKLGASPELVSPNMNSFTSDVFKMFAYAAREYETKTPDMTSGNILAKIALKNRQHGVNNPYACMTKPTTLDDIATPKRTICHPITLGMCTLTADGGAAAVVCSEEFVRENGLRDKAIEVIAQNLVTDLPSSFGEYFRDVCGYSMAKTAAARCFRDSGMDMRDVDVVEVHDCFSCNELFMYEALQLAEEGKGCDLFNSGKWIFNRDGGQVYQMGGRWVVNPSGGLISKGHPIGATGLAQCAELVWQLRGEAGKRQVDGAKVGLQHNFGIGGAAVVTMYKKPEWDTAVLPKAKL